jgi:hypothetical protein
VLNGQLSLLTASRDEIVAAYQVQAAIGRLTSIDLSLPVRGSTTPLQCHRLSVRS